MHAAAVIVEDRSHRVLLLLRGPTAPWMPLRWDLPGGVIEPGESAIDAATREAREETSLDVQMLVPFAHTDAGTGSLLHVFYARRWSGRVRLNDREHISHAWVPRHAIGDWALVPTQREVLRWFARSPRR